MGAMKDEPEVQGDAILMAYKASRVARCLHHKRLHAAPVIAADIVPAHHTGAHVSGR